MLSSRGVSAALVATIAAPNTGRLRRSVADPRSRRPSLGMVSTRAMNVPTCIAAISMMIQAPATITPGDKDGGNDADGQPHPSLTNLATARSDSRVVIAVEFELDGGRADRLVPLVEGLSAAMVLAIVSLISPARAPRACPGVRGSSAGSRSRDCGWAGLIGGWVTTEFSLRYVFAGGDGDRRGLPALAPPAQALSATMPSTRAST